jgi:hypothetical protein
MKPTCQCNHEAAHLQQEIAAGRPVHEYRIGEDSEYVLVCLTCLGLWDHSATDRLIEDIMKSKDEHRCIISTLKKPTTPRPNTL